MLYSSEAEQYVEAIKFHTGLETQVELSNYFGIAQSAIAGWIRRNSVRTIKKYIELKKLNLSEIEKTVKKYKEQNLGIQLMMLEDKQKERFKNLEKETSNTQHNFSINFQVGFYTVIDELRITIFDAVENFIDRDNSAELTKLVEDFDALCNYVVTPAAAKMIETIENFREKREQDMRESNARAREKQLESQGKKPQ
jgi:hypothetical protein